MNKKDFYKQKNKQKIIFASIITILILIVTFSSITLANTRTEAISKGHHKTAYIKMLLTVLPSRIPLVFHSGTPPAVIDNRKGGFS